MVNAPSPSGGRLARYLNGDAIGNETDELAGWLTAAPRFAAFADANRDKIRKKLRGATDAAARLDVRAELQVARWLLADRRIELDFEPDGSVRGGPDFRVAFRSHPAFNLEVTRPRRAPDTTGIARIVLAKLRQLPPGMPNVIAIAVDALVDGPTIADAARHLRSRADAGDAAMLARGGFASGRDFYQRFLRLAAVVTCCEAADGDSRAAVWINPSARISVPDRALRACLAALRSG